MDTRAVSKLLGKLFIIALFAACGGKVFESAGGPSDGGAGKGGAGSSSGGTSGTSGGTGGKGGSVGSDGSGGSGGTGGRGGTGGISGSTGFGGSGGSGGSGGVAGAAVVGGTLGAGGSAGGSCSDSDGVNAGVRGTTTGINGMFADVCDSSGNLIEYVCDATGNAVAVSINCGGGCVYGACTARCPHQGDALKYLSVDSMTGNAQIENVTDGNSYTCTIYFDAAGGFDCKSATAGLSAQVASLGVPGTSCPTSGSFGNIGVAPQGYTGEECGYSCAFM